MLKKLWQRLTGKAEVEEDEKQEDGERGGNDEQKGGHRTGTPNHRADQIIREGDVWAYLISLTLQFFLMVGRAAVDKVPGPFQSLRKGRNGWRGGELWKTRRYCHRNSVC